MAGTTTEARLLKAMDDLPVLRIFDAAAKLAKGEGAADILVRTILEAFALLEPEEKKLVLAETNPEVGKAMRNAYLLAQATAHVPTADEGFAARALRQMHARRRTF